MTLYIPKMAPTLIENLKFWIKIDWFYEIKSIRFESVLVKRFYNKK